MSRLGVALDRAWWLAVGVVAGVFVTVRATGRVPQARSLRVAAGRGAADLLGLGAAMLRPRPRPRP